MLDIQLMICIRKVRIRIKEVKKEINNQVYKEVISRAT